MTDLAFEVQDVYLTGLIVDRGPMKPTSDKMLHAQIGFDIQAAEFTAGESRLKVTTRFRVSLFMDGPPMPADAADAPNLVGSVETRFTANVDTSRPLDESDASDGALEPSLEAALPAMHPYHRAMIESHSAMLGVSPLRLPVDWAEVAANFSEVG